MRTYSCGTLGSSSQGVWDFGIDPWIEADAWEKGSPRAVPESSELSFWRLWKGHEGNFCGGGPPYSGRFATDNPHQNYLLKVERVSYLMERLNHNKTCL